MLASVGKCNVQVEAILSEYCPTRRLSQFMYNIEKGGGVQVVILKTPEACQMFNRLMTESKNVLFILHNTC